MTQDEISSAMKLFIAMRSARVFADSTRAAVDSRW